MDLCGVLTVCLVLGTAATVGEADPDQVVTAFIKAYNAGEAETIHRTLDAGFQKALLLPAFTKFLTQARTEFGDIKAWTKARPEGPWLIFRCKGEKQPCVLKLVLDDDGRIAGLQLGRDGPGQAAIDKTVAAVIAALNAGSALDLHRLFEARFQASLPLEQLEPLVKKQREQSGAIKDWESVRVTGTWRLYRVHADKREFTLHVVVETDGRLGGLRFSAPLAMVLPAGPVKLADLKKRFQTAAEQTLAESRMPSISAALIRGDTMVWAEGFGQHNLACKVRADERTVYVTGSVLKVLVATAIMQLVDEGKLDLDAPIDALSPELKVPNPFASETPLTARHLLSHRGGVPNGGSEMPLWQRQVPAPLEEMLKRRARVTAKPGTKTLYSNVGYSLLGYLLGLQSGKTFEQAMQDRLFVPLGMKHAAFVPTPEMTEHLAIPYEDDPRQNKLVPTYRVRLDVQPAGDLYATPSDLARFLILHLNEGKFGGKQLLRPESIKEMTRLQYEKRAGGFGLAWVADYRNSRPFLWHNGGVRGFSSYMAIDPERKLGIVLLANRFDPEADPLPDLARFGLELLDRLVLAPKE